MDDMLGQQWPKGLEPPAPPPEPATQPEPVTFARGNYMASIYQALGLLPFNVAIVRATVVEELGRPPMVKIRLEIQEEKPGHAGLGD